MNEKEEKEEGGTRAKKKYQKLPNHGEHYCNTTVDLRRHQTIECQLKR